MTARIRLNFLVHPAVRQRLEHLTERVLGDSMTETLRRAVFVLSWVVAAVERGAVFTVTEPNGSRRRVALDDITRGDS